MLTCRFNLHELSDDSLLPGPDPAFVAVEPPEIENGGFESLVFIALELFHSFSSQLKDLLVDLLFLAYRLEPNGDEHVPRPTPRPVRRFVVSSGFWHQKQIVGASCGV